ncbi:uncharacterized protein DUF2188 [Breoghania corrubedonensis]|uniref:Uncharacterized protein DUF2188 n=1 Tax=Breoghania corrubedonensis TaxID=665038 RepID=A0A2T5V6M9_9HYPH|nr:DUF2188 domain-containing protein [Breoghania corrubedonensis]PTW59386.1 uncharacterized protein DUF2188 [Breoghania corrubedonensis]
MKKIEVVQREDGWAYVVEGRVSQSFGTREDAQAAGKAAAEEQAEKEGELEEGLRDTFPASDPVSVTQSGHTGGDND